MYIEDVKTLDDARACAEALIREAWKHAFTEDIHVDAMNRLFDRVAAITPARVGNEGTAAREARRFADLLPELRDLK